MYFPNQAISKNFSWRNGKIREGDHGRRPRTWWEKAKHTRHSTSDTEINEQTIMHQVIHTNMRDYSSMLSIRPAMQKQKTDKQKNKKNIKHERTNHHHTKIRTQMRKHTQTHTNTHKQTNRVCKGPNHFAWFDLNELTCASKVLRWGVELARALCFLHNCSPIIIHRDLKPANLLLNEDGHMKVMSLGRLWA